MDKRRSDMQPALCNVAESLCIYDMTDGFCTPRVKDRCKCWRRAEELMRSSGFSALALVWILKNRKRIENDAGYPEIRFITQYEGMMLSMAPSFEPKDGEKDFDMDKAWALAERGFNNSELEEAIGARNVLIKSVTEQEGEL